MTTKTFLLAIGITTLLLMQNVVAQKPIIYQISGNGLEKPSYLFGTLHLACKDDLSLNSTVKDALYTTNRLVLEIDESKVNPFSIMKLMVMSGDTTLKMLLSNDEYERMKQLLKDSASLNVSLFANMKPLLVSSLMLRSFAPCKTSQITSYEKELSKLASKKKIKTEALETIEFQLSLFDSISYTQQAKMLLESCDSFSKSRNDFNRLLTAYNNADLTGLEDLMRESWTSDAGQFEKLLLDTRNENWIPIMVKMMAEKPTFFAVGAAHLIGNYGIIYMLTQKGYEVKPL